jgi:hypothetical protein
MSRTWSNQLKTNNKMKKHLIILFCLALTASLPISAQKLVELYKKGTIRLVADKTFAQGNDWNFVFRAYQDSMGGRNVGARKSLVLLPDGSVIVNNTYRNFYTKFNPQGKFAGEFNLKSTSGKVFKKTEPALGVLYGNTLYYGIDNPGNMYLTDFNGKWQKTLKLNFIAKQIISLPNNKLAMTGFSIKDGAIRHFVEIVNPATNEENIIWEHKSQGASAMFESSNTSERPMFNYGYLFKTGGGIGFTVDFEGTSNRYTEPIIACSGNKMLLAFPDNGELWEYDLTGKMLAKKRLGWTRESVSVEEQKKTLQEEINKLKTTKLGKARNTNTDEELAEAKAKFLKEMEEDLGRITTTLPRPCLSTVIKDSEGNLLYFEYPKEKDANLFHVWVYSNGGSFVCESKFVCEDYDLIINPSRMVFRNGYLYSLQNVKGAKGVPMRLVRFRLTAE